MRCLCRKSLYNLIAMSLVAAFVVFVAATEGHAANPCAANPCAANPCEAPNPCAANPCAAARGAKLTGAEAIAAYQSIMNELQAGYAKSGQSIATDYINWKSHNVAPYISETHGGRFVNNFANDLAQAYGEFENAGVMPLGSVLAKDSFRVTPEGKAEAGPLFLMEKMAEGFNSESGDWRFSMIMPDGTIYGATKGKNAAKIAFCAECHGAVAEEQDFMFFIPTEYRVE